MHFCKFEEVFSKWVIMAELCGTFMLEGSKAMSSGPLRWHSTGNRPYIKYPCIQLEFRIRDVHLQAYISFLHLLLLMCWRLQVVVIPFSSPSSVNCECSLYAPGQSWQARIETQLGEYWFYTLSVCHMDSDTSVAEVGSINNFSYCFKSIHKNC